MAQEPGGIVGLLSNMLSPMRETTDTVVEPQTTAGVASGAPVNLGPEGVATPTNNIPPMLLPESVAPQAPSDA